MAGSRSDDPPTGKNKLLRQVFIDWPFSKPDWPRHIKIVEKHRPLYAVAPDIEKLDDLETLRDQVASLARYADKVIVVPKVSGIIDEVMQWPSVILGYSVPTKYGATDVPIWEFAHHPVHLLGGSPREQVRLASYMNVVSVDCKAHFRAAGYGTYYNEHLRVVPIRDDQLNNETGMMASFRLSSRNIFNAWKSIGAVNTSC